MSELQNLLSAYKAKFWKSRMRGLCCGNILVNSRKPNFPPPLPTLYIDFEKLYKIPSNISTVCFQHLYCQANLNSKCYVTKSVILQVCTYYCPMSMLQIIFEIWFYLVTLYISKLNTNLRSVRRIGTAATIAASKLSSFDIETLC